MNRLDEEILKVLNEDTNNNKISKEEWDKMSPREHVRFLLKKSKETRQSVSKEHIDKINKLLVYADDYLNAGDIMFHELLPYMVKNNLKVKDIIPYIDKDARLSLNIGCRHVYRPAADEALLDIFLGWYHVNPKTSSYEDEKQIMSGLLEEDYVEYN